MSDGWTYQEELNYRGLCLKNLQHDGHSLLDEACMVKTYAQIEDGQNSNFVDYQMGVDVMQSELTPVKTSYASGRAPDYYHTLSSQVYAPFNVQDFVGSSQQFSGKQYYAFTAPSDTPRHETTGFAKAGRFYPAFDFELPQKSTEQDAKYISKLRFDYYLDLNVAGGGRRHSVYNPLPELGDQAQYAKRAFQHVVNSLNSGQLPGNIPPQPPRRDIQHRAFNKEQAALFRDLDANIVSRTFGRSLGGGKHTFSAAEKPLLWEVVGDGILNGPQEEPEPEAGYWDNMHAWGHNHHGLVSTPGMPYGFHLHWRWASSVSDKTSMLFGRWGQGFLGAPELAARDTNNNPVFGGPLIDPNLPSQDLRIAFVKKDTALSFANEVATSHDDFENIFTRIKNQPDVIKDGTDCVIIISIVVHREDPDAIWGGTIFPHGIFFPHDYNPPLPLLLGLPFEWAYSEQYITQKPNRQWKRNPR